MAYNKGFWDKKDMIFFTTADKLLKEKEQTTLGGVNMEQEKTTGKMPDFKGTIDCAAWVNKDRNGKTYISVRIGAISINLFKNEPKQFSVKTEEVL